MIIISFVNFAAFGVTWLTGGLTRTLGQCFARRDEQGFALLYGLGKWTNVIYGILVSGVAGLFFWLSFKPPSAMPQAVFDLVSQAVWFAAVYFVILYSFSVDRVALIARGAQTISNLSFDADSDRLCCCRRSSHLE